MVGCKKYKIQYELKQEIKNNYNCKLKEGTKISAKNQKFIFSIQILFTTQL